MPRQGNHAEERTGKPSWRDVAEGLEYLERTYAGHAEVSMDREGVKGVGEAMWVYVKLYAGFKVLDAKPVHVARQLWPSLAYRDLSSLVFRLIHSIDHMAAAQRQAEQADLPF